MSLVYSLHEPQCEPEGVLVGFFEFTKDIFANSEEFGKFIILDLIDYPQSYYRVDKETGLYRDPLRYCEALKQLLDEKRIGPDKVMAWGSSRGATMALFVALEMHLRCAIVTGPQIDALADISMVNGLQNAQLAGDEYLRRGERIRIKEESLFYLAIHRSIKRGEMDFLGFFNAIQGLDLSIVMFRASPPYPRMVLQIGAENLCDEYLTAPFEAAARLKGAPLWVYRHPTEQHAIWLNYSRPIWMGWFRDVWEGRIPDIPEARRSDP